MSHISGVVYDPPSPEVPHIVVLFEPNGEVLGARRVGSLREGEQFLLQYMEGVAKDLELKVQISKT